MQFKFFTTLILFGLFYTHTYCQNTTIVLDASTRGKPISKAWTYFGYDEPNFTYTQNGKKLLKELSHLTKTPLRVRTHNLLTSNVGVPPDLKWGYTDVYNEDANGKALYNWAILDSIFDTYVALGIKPLVEIGFMPKALSSKPDPYAHSWSAGGNIWTGWTYPPTDYRKWESLVYEWVMHSIKRYGTKEIRQWLWQVWNEPNIGYWSGTPEEYHKLYDHASKAVKKACPSCKIGGPHTTNPDGEKAIQYLKGFIDHCLNGTNYATGKKGSPLDFVAFHAKGNPTWADNHIRMGLQNQLMAIDNGFKIIASYPELKNIPVIIGENDPEGCAACSAKRDPKYGYRNGTMYPVYTAASYPKIYSLADRHKINLVGALTWAFQFENQEWYAGFRDLATNGVNKAIFNVFRMFSMMSGNELSSISNGSIPIDQIVTGGVKDKPDIGSYASSNGKDINILIWNYHDDDIISQPAEIQLTITNLNSKKYSYQHYRIDSEHSNSYTAWLNMGAPQQVNDEQRKVLNLSSQLTFFDKPRDILTKESQIVLSFSLPRQGVSFIRLHQEN